VSAHQHQSLLHQDLALVGALSTVENGQPQALLTWVDTDGEHLTVMSTMAKGLRAPQPDPDELPPTARCDLATEVGKSLESLGVGLPVVAGQPGRERGGSWRDDFPRHRELLGT